MEMTAYLELVRAAVLSCELPNHLHPFSERILDLFQNGLVSAETFRIYFHMCNSTYYTFTECILDAIESATVISSTTTEWQF